LSQSEGAPFYWDLEGAPFYFASVRRGSILLWLRRSSILLCLSQKGLHSASTQKDLHSTLSQKELHSALLLSGGAPFYFDFFTVAKKKRWSCGYVRHNGVYGSWSSAPLILNPRLVFCWYCATCTSTLHLLFFYMDTLKLSVEGHPIVVQSFLWYSLSSTCSVIRCLHKTRVFPLIALFGVTSSRAVHMNMVTKIVRQHPADCAIATQSPVSRRYLAVALCVAEPLRKEWRYDWYSEILRAVLDCVGRIKEYLVLGPTYFTTKLRAEFTFVLLLRGGSYVVLSLWSTVRSRTVVPY
jgi:hypothetical protein